MIFVKKIMRATLAGLFSFAFLQVFSINYAAAETNYTIPDEDVLELQNQLFNSKLAFKEEGLNILKWAGISDPRVFDPIVARVKATRGLNKKYLYIYIEAIIASGNEKYIPILEEMTTDPKLTIATKNAIKNLLPRFPKYRAISELMNNNDSEYSSRQEFWTKRYRKGLNIEDSERVQLAARDLYLRGFEVEYYNIAAEYIEQNYLKLLDDGSTIDAMSYLCKSLGLSKRQEYQSLLIKVANFAKNKKVAKYAQAAVIYNNPAFRSSNPVLNSRKSH